MVQAARQLAHGPGLYRHAQQGAAGKYAACRVLLIPDRHQAAVLAFTPL
jgi:hypothetical protein